MVIGITEPLKKEDPASGIAIEGTAPPLLRVLYALVRLRLSEGAKGDGLFRMKSSLGAST